MVKERTGLRYMKLIEAAVQEQDGEAIAVLFWVVDRRTNPDLKFSDYEGPPLRVFLEAIPGFNQVVVNMGKAMGIPESEMTTILTTPTNGGPTSPSSTPDASTGPSTTG